MQWLEFDKEGKIIGHHCGKKMPEGKQYKEVTGAFNGTVGMTKEWLDLESGGRVLPLPQLIEKGLVTDKRGTWYHKQTRQIRNVTMLNEIPDEEWTQELPDHDDPYCIWSEKSGTWEHDSIAEEKYSVINRKMKIEKELADGTALVLNAYEEGIPFSKMYPGEKEKRDRMRKEINQLESRLLELK